MNFDDEVRAIFLRKLQDRATSLSASSALHSRKAQAVPPQEPWNWLKESPNQKNSQPLWAPLAVGVFAIALVFGFTRCSDAVREITVEVFRSADPAAGAAGEKAGASFVGLVNYPPDSDRLAFLARGEGKATGLTGADCVEWENGFMRGYRARYSKSR